jgi:ATP-dependent DNA ligase
VSRRGHAFNKFGILETEISHGIRPHDAVLDGEIVCLDRNGRSNFSSLPRQRTWPRKRDEIRIVAALDNQWPGKE